MNICEYICIYIYIYEYIGIYIYIYIFTCSYMYIYTYINVPKCMSCNKAIVVINGRAHCFHDFIYILHLFCFCEIWEKFEHFIYIYIYIYIYILLLLLTGFGGHANVFFISTLNIILISKSFFHSRVLKTCTYTIQRTVMKAI